MKKYYRVKKDTFMWNAGAILVNSVKNSKSEDGYEAIDDIWNKVDLQTEYISGHIIENPANADIFERVYADNLGGKLYKTRDQMIAYYKDQFTE